MQLPSLLRRPTSDLNLSGRAKRCLDNAEIVTLRNIVSRTQTDLLRITNLGKETLKEIKQKLEAYSPDLSLLAE